VKPPISDLLRRADAQLRAGAVGEARTMLEAAAVEEPLAAAAPEFWALLAQARLQDGAPEPALEAVDHALAIRGEWVAALHLRARALRDVGRFDDAFAAVGAALNLRPADAAILATLGMIEQRRGRLTASRAAFEQSLVQAPGEQRTWRAYAELLEAMSQESDALAAWRRWMELSGESAAVLARYGSALATAHRWDDAERMLVRASSLANADSVVHQRIAQVRAERGDEVGALAAFEIAREQMPRALTPRFAHALFLPQVYQSVEDVAAWRARYVDGLSKLEAEVPELLRAPHELWRLDWSNFYLGYQGYNDVEPQRRYSAIVAKLAEAAAPEWMQPLECRAAPGRLRVGFASSFFRNCTVGTYFSAWPLGLDRARFEVSIFHFGNEIDETTTRLQSAAEHFAHVGRSVKAIAAAIQGAALDVLIYPQLGMDGRDSTLAALRLAPIQCAAWGHPETTGGANIDYFLSCEAMEPQDAPQHYAERLLLLPGLGTRYPRPRVPLASRGQFGLPESVRLYACPHSLFKIHPEFDDVFAEVLALDPLGRVVLCADQRLPSGIRFAARLQKHLSQRGLDPGRLLFQPLRPPDEFRALLSVCDVMIDTTRWSGGNTALDALAATLPIVAAPGELMRGRQSAAMLRQIGLDDLVVDDSRDLAQRAVAVARHPSPFRERIAGNRNALFDRSEPIQALAGIMSDLADVGFSR
jgi:CRISPR-associated protein Csy1